MAMNYFSVTFVTRAACKWTKVIYAELWQLNFKVLSLTTSTCAAKVLTLIGGGFEFDRNITSFRGLANS